MSCPQVSLFICVWEIWLAQDNYSPPPSLELLMLIRSSLLGVETCARLSYRSVFCTLPSFLSCKNLHNSLWFSFLVRFYLITMSTEAPFGFIMSVYPRPSSCFGANTPFSLNASTRQVSFRKITDLRLKRLLIHVDPPVLLAVKMILGSAHLNREEYPRDNTCISSRFVASLLDQKLPKQAVWSLTKELFPEEILQEFQEILNKALHDSGAPRPSDRILFNAHGDLIKYYPFLLDLKGKDLDRHRVFAGVGLSYLKWRFLGENPEVQGK